MNLVVLFGFHKFEVRLCRLFRHCGFWDDELGRRFCSSGILLWGVFWSV